MVAGWNAEGAKQGNQLGNAAQRSVLQIDLVAALLARKCLRQFLQATLDLGQDRVETRELGRLGHTLILWRATKSTRS